MRKALVLALLGVTTALPVGAADPFHAELDAWRQERAAALRRPDGWLTLVGLYWLDPGDNRVGSAADARVRLPAAAPARVGVLERRGETVRFVPAAGVDLRIDGQPARPTDLRSDSDGGEPSVVSIGSVSFFIIQRGERLAARVKDSESAARRDFAGIESYPPDPSWRLEARFEPYRPVKQVRVPTMLGTMAEMDSPGAVVFAHGGQTLRLDVFVEPGESDYFLIFGDTTNRRETYGGGRFLYAHPADATGRTVLDFNRAYNPPCAFSPYATCPLPPRQNRLPVAIEAGEKRYAHGVH